MVITRSHSKQAESKDVAGQQTGDKIDPIIVRQTRSSAPSVSSSASPQYASNRKMNKQTSAPARPEEQASWRPPPPTQNDAKTPPVTPTQQTLQSGPYPTPNTVSRAEKGTSRATASKRNVVDEIEPPRPKHKRAAAKQPAEVVVQDQGIIAFFYKPKVMREDVSDFDDIARTYLVLHSMENEDLMESLRAEAAVKDEPDDVKQESDEPTFVIEASQEDVAVKREVKQEVDDSSIPSDASKVQCQDPPKADNIAQLGRAAKTDAKKLRPSNLAFDFDPQHPCLMLSVLRKELSNRDPLAIYHDPLSIEELQTELGEKHDSTKTRGERTYLPSRPFAIGVYILSLNRSQKVRGGQKQETFLTYDMTYPKYGQYSEVMARLGIARRGRFQLATKNPQHENNDGAVPTKVEYPDYLQHPLGTYAWGPTLRGHLTMQEGVVLLIQRSHLREWLGRGDEHAVERLLDACTTMNPAMLAEQLDETDEAVQSLVLLKRKLAPTWPDAVSAMHALGVQEKDFTADVLEHGTWY